MAIRFIVFVFSVINYSHSFAEVSLETGLIYKNQMDENSLPPGVTLADNRKRMLALEWKSNSRPLLDQNHYQLKSNIERGYSDEKVKKHTQFSYSHLHPLDADWLNNLKMSVSSKTDEFNTKDSYDGLGVETTIIPAKHNPDQKRLTLLLKKEAHDDHVVPYEIKKMGVRLAYALNKKKHQPFFEFEGDYFNNNADDYIWSNTEFAVGIAYKNWVFLGMKGKVALKVIEKQFKVALPPPPAAGPPPPGPPPSPMPVSDSELLDSIKLLKVVLKKRIDKSISMLWLSHFEHHKDARVDLDEHEYRHEMRVRWVF